MHPYYNCRILLFGFITFQKQIPLDVLQLNMMYVDTVIKTHNSKLNYLQKKMQ